MNSQSKGVICQKHGFIQMTPQEIEYQLRLDGPWRCIICGGESRFSEPQQFKTLSATSFTFKDVRGPCPYWSNGSHIVAAVSCRCGKKFRVVEVT